MCCQRSSLAKVTNSVVAIVSLDSSWRMIFCFKAVNLGTKSFSLGFLHFLVTMVNSLLGPLEAANLGQEVRTNVVVIYVGACVL